MRLKPPFCMLACAAILLMTAAELHAQAPIYEVFGKTQGLRGRSIFQCFQDSRRRLWVSSDYGVSLLDGREFRALGAEKGMPEMVVLRIGEDVQKNLWFLTMNGCPARFDGDKVTTQWGEAFANEIRGANYLSAFAAAKDGSMIFGTHDGRAFRMFPDGSYKFLFAENWGGIQLIDAHDDGSFTFHFSKVNAIARLKGDKLTYQPFAPLLEDWSNGTLRIRKLRDGRFIYAVENRIAIVEASGDTLRKVSQFQIPEKTVLFVDQDWRGDIWIGTNQGAIQYRAKDSLLQAPIRFLPNQFVSSICRDHEDGLWFTTQEGLFHCKNENIYSSSMEFCVQNDEATAIFPSQDGTIYLGFESGKVQRISRKTFQVMKEYPNPFQRTQHKIEKFLDGPQGAVMIAAYSGLVLLRDEKMTVLSNMRLADFSIQGDEIGTCLYSGWSRVHLDSAGQWQTTIGKQLQQAQASKSNRCLHCAHDSAGYLWVTTFTDVLRVKDDQVDTLFSQSVSDAGYQNSCILATANGKVLFGTSNHGVFIVHGMDRFHLGKQNGLIDNHVVNLYADAQGNGWILTSKGLTKVSLATSPPAVLTSIGRNNLFGDADVHEFFVLQDTLWAAAGNGFVMFPTGILNQRLQAPSVEISSISINNRERPYTAPMQLQPNENNVRLHYRAITFSDPQLVEYRYRIGQDSFQTTYSQAIDLPNLAPDVYRVEIQARHSFGDWSRQSAVVEFEVIPPYWKTAWFIVLVVIGVALLVTFIVWQIIRDIRRKSALREALAAARHDALIHQMNPHFVFNSLNSIQNFVLNNETEVANNYLADFAALMRAILVNGRSPFIPISDEIRFLQLYLGLESLRLDHKFDFSIAVSKGIIPSTHMLPPMMLQPLLENSIWHGIAPLEDRKGKLNVELLLQGGYIECLVKDNGIGRKMAAERAQRFGKKHQSLASTIMVERIELMNNYLTEKIRLDIRDLVDADGRGIGTEVRLSIPLSLSKEHTS